MVMMMVVMMMVVVVTVWGDVVMVVGDEDAVKRLVCGSRYQHRTRRASASTAEWEITQASFNSKSICTADRS